MVRSGLGDSGSRIVVIVAGRERDREGKNWIGNWNVQWKIYCHSISKLKGLSDPAHRNRNHVCKLTGKFSLTFLYYAFLLFLSSVLVVVLLLLCKASRRVEFVVASYADEEGRENSLSLSLSLCLHPHDFGLTFKYTEQCSVLPRNGFYVRALVVH